MSKRKKKKGAEKLEAQARAHEALYGTDWKEVTEYRRQALEIIEKHRIKPDDGKIADDEIKIFEKRLKEFEDGKRKMLGELPFYRILRLVSKGESINSDNRIEAKNLQLLEVSGYVKDGKLTARGRNLLKVLER
jgi:hypothetical protein